MSWSGVVSSLHSIRRRALTALFGLALVVTVLAAFSGKPFAAGGPPYVPGAITLGGSTSALSPGNVLLTWSGGGNPAGVTYEAWRRQFNGTGAEIANLPIYIGTSDIGFIQTRDQGMGKYWRYRVRASMRTGTNLLPTNPATVELGTVGFSSVGAAGLNTSTTYRYGGERSLLISQAGYVGSGVALPRLWLSGTVTFSVYLYSPSYSTTASVGFRDHYGASLGSTWATVSGTWTRVSHTASLGSSARWVEPVVTLPSPFYYYVYGDNFQVQLGNLTTWEAPVEVFSDFTPEVTYWTLPSPVTIAETYGGLQVSYPAVYPGVSMSVESKTTTSSTWSTATTTTATSYLYPLSGERAWNLRITSVLPDGGPVWYANSTIASYTPYYVKPSGFTSTNLSQTGHTLWWKLDGTGIPASATVRITRDGAQVYQGIPTYSSTRPPGETTGTWASLAQTGLTPGQTYTYTVCVLDAKSRCGEERTLTVTTHPNVPTSLALSNAATPQHQSTLTWSANGNASGVVYELRRKTFNHDGSEASDALLYTGVSTAFTTTDQVPGTWYRYRVRAVAGGTNSADTGEVAYWTAPTPATASFANELRMTWTAPIETQPINLTANNSFTVYGCGWNSYGYYSFPATAYRIRVKFQGTTQDGWGLALNDGSNYWWQIGMNSAPGPYDQWITPQYPATQYYVSIHDCGGGGATFSIPQIMPDSSTKVHVQYSTDGTTWTTAQTSFAPTAVNLPLSPANKYKVALVPASLPNGGVAHRTTDDTWYSPQWKAPLQFKTGTIGQTSLPLWWASGAYSSGANLANSAKVRIKRDGEIVYEGVPTYALQTQWGLYDYWTSWQDTSVEPGKSYTYTICGLNALNECGAEQTLTVLTLPATPAAPEAQFGSFGWRTAPTSGAWGEFAFPAVRSATNYKVYLSGPETRTVTLPAPAGDPVLLRLTDLRSGGDYTVKVTAVNATGESPQSAAVQFSTPLRADGTAPSTASLLLNEGAPTTGGSRVLARGTATDSGSGVWGVQLSNDGTTWSTSLPLRDWMRENSVEVMGGNSRFTDLGGWVSDHGIWAVTAPDATAEQGGRAARIRWDLGPAGRWKGLRLNPTLPAAAGRTYTVQVRYRVEGLTTGSVALWSHWVQANGRDVPGDPNADRILAPSSQWTTVQWTDVAPAETTGRWIALGFDQANAGAVLIVDYVVINEGEVPVAPGTPVGNPLTGTTEWQLENTAFGTKTVRARFVDTAGNISGTVQASIQWLLTDTAAPRVTVLINGGASTTTTRNVTLTVSAEDDQSPQSLLRVRFSADAVSWSPWETYQPSRGWTLGVLEGRQYARVQVQDGAGNVGEGIAWIFYRLPSTVAPNDSPLQAKTGTAGAFTSGEEVVAVQYTRLSEVTLLVDTAALAGVKTVRYGFDQRYSAWETVAEGRTLQLPQVQGIQTLYMQTDDGRTFQVRFLLDSEAPEVSVFWAGGATITRPGGKATLVIAAEDNLARPEDLQVSINGGAYAPWVPDQEITLVGAGLQQVVVTVRDPAGNRSSKVLSIFVQP